MSAYHNRPGIEQYRASLPLHEPQPSILNHGALAPHLQQLTNFVEKIDNKGQFTGTEAGVEG